MFDNAVSGNNLHLHTLISIQKKWACIILILIMMIRSLSHSALVRSSRSPPHLLFLSIHSPKSTYKYAKDKPLKMLHHLTPFNLWKGYFDWPTPWPWKLMDNMFETLNTDHKNRIPSRPYYWGVNISPFFFAVWVGSPLVSYRSSMQTNDNIDLTLLQHENIF